jgi:hypothetical protein
MAVRLLPAKGGCLRDPHICIQCAISAKRARRYGHGMSMALAWSPTRSRPPGIRLLHVKFGRSRNIKWGKACFHLYISSFGGTKLMTVPLPCARQILAKYSWLLLEHPTVYKPTSRPSLPIAKAGDPAFCRTLARFIFLSWLFFAGSRPLTSPPRRR